MPGGYFDDGQVQVELGAHAFATPAAERRNLLLVPYGLPAVALEDGGGVLHVSVTGQSLRENLGDAERYVVELFRALAAAGAGTLGVEDNLARRATFGRSVCVGAVGEVRAFRFVEMKLDFQCPEDAAAPAWGAVPSGPAAWPGTATAQDYAIDAGAGGVALGVGGAMRIEMVRRYPVRPLPRSRGARSCGPQSGAHLRFIVTAHRLAAEDGLAADLQGLERSIGPGPVALTANGNTYSDLLLDSLRPKHGDRSHTSFEAEFIQGI
jgi:hypothetical protein